MKDFRLFDITDFVMDEDFIRWVYGKNNADTIFWNAWLAQHPGKHLIVSEARRILESVKTTERPVSEAAINTEVDRLLQTIRGQPQKTVQPVPVRSLYSKWWYAAAAVLLMVIAGSQVLQLKQPAATTRFAYSNVVAARRLVESVNTSDKPITIVLPDKSIIALAPNGRVSYANDFDSAATRDIYLSGEAFFKVTKDPGHPFRVFANEIVTKVLGTSFTVRAFEKDTTIQVTVRTGKVSVYSQALTHVKETAAPGELGGIILTPNQQLVYEKSGQKFQKVLLDQPCMIAPFKTEAEMVFEDVPLEQVFDQLFKVYGINIVYDNELLKACTVNADLRNETFYHQLDLICRAIGARYQVIDGQVVIQSTGCQ
jgi:ferric-dicitrate binding protein FerR (iron transport regulator)